MKTILNICLINITLLININVAAQSEFLVKSLDFVGLKKTKAHFLSRIAKVKPGFTADSLKVKTDVERIKRLDGIAHADYQIQKEADGYKVIYTIKENFSIIPGFRVGEANDGSFAYRISAFEFNGFGRNIIFGGFFNREVFNGFGAFVEHPYLFTNKLGLGLNYTDDTSQQPIYFDLDNPDNPTNYAYTRQGPEATIFYELNFKNRFELGSKIFKEEYSLITGDPDNEGLEGLVPEPNANKAFLRGSHEYVNIDIQYQNQSGFRNFADVTYFIGGEGALKTEYILSNTTQYFKRIGTQGNLATQIQLRYSNPTDNSFFVPITIDNQLNTRGAGNTIDRGTSSTTLNTEYRHTLYEKGWFVVQGNAFTDISSIQRTSTDFIDQFSSDSLRVYSGVGVRLIHKYIFNAVLRFDYGVNINNNGDNGFVFGIGQYF